MTGLRVAVVLLLGSTFGAPLSSAPQAPAESPSWATKPLRAGIIGTDTSHVPQFVKTFHAHPEWKIRIVAAFKGGSPDLPLSANRIEGFTKTIQADGVEIVDSIDALLSKVDVVLLTSVDGRPHLAQVTPVLKAGKRVHRQAARRQPGRCPANRGLVQTDRDPVLQCFVRAISPRRFPHCARSRASARIKKVEATYVLNKLEFHPDLFYYGIHGVEALYAVMGTGCTSLSRRMDGDVDITTCTWKDGRVGAYRGLPKADPSQPLIRMTGETGTAETTGGGRQRFPHSGDRRVLSFTGRSPVDAGQTIEVRRGS